MGKASRKPKYYDCPCGRKLRLDGVKIPAHKDLRTGTLCLSYGGFIPEVKKQGGDAIKTLDN